MKKKLTPAQARLQIKALIQENFELKSEEFIKFQKEVEENGLLNEQDFPTQE